ncbi:glycosyltransferase [Phenylobacterium deserti]|uniref:Glycosyltransferase 2-like domain-containing protein n=1 Tax=Phenylobacterium deserti TaxID=1914756 RepID=A0A328ASE5_9CAUL|nr:glycosyltransferase [Phenylobacterium deserti]RAK56444.1 hypothetical protein DJ018_00185 [Phenylobacterium deserti]
MDKTPIVSVIMTRRAADAPLAGSVRSVLGQTLRALELIIVEEGPGVEAAQAAAEDPRVRTVTGAPLSAARERALRSARGQWVAVMDAGDILRRDRLERLVLSADAEGADLVADNQMIFSEDGRRPTLLFPGDEPLAGAKGLKPLIRRTRLAELGGYEAGVFETDDGLVRRLVEARLKLRTFAEPTYLKRVGGGAERSSAGKRVVFLSRQRVTGANTGSSTYLLSVAKALREAGYEPSFLGVAPTIFGRWPVLRLKPETKVFADYRIRGSVRFGDWIIALDPKIAWSAGLTALELVLGKLKVKKPGWVKPAPYSVAVPHTKSDMLFVARNAGPGVAGVLCDYAFLAPMAAYALAPEAPVQVLMHDLFSSRPQQFAKVGAQDSVATLDAAEEFRLLACADTVLAIQATEAEEVSRRLLDRQVIVAPMAVEVGAPEPGRADEVLFVGSNTAPNTIGIRWFMDEVWPRVRAARPDAKLKIAGSVSRSLDGVPDGVEVLGVVDSLDPLYRQAGVVISPLLTGSGLKIKLVEGLAAGKAMVVTTTTLQGVEAIAGPAVRLADEPAPFADHVLELLASDEARARLCERAVRCAADHFSPAACYGEAIRAFAQPPAAPAAFVEPPRASIAV